MPSDGEWFLSCHGGAWRLVCLLDNLNHAILGRHGVRWLCDAHDRHLLGDVPDDEVTHDWA